MFYCAVTSLATAIAAAFVGFVHAASLSGAAFAQHVFLAALVAFVLTSLRVVFDPEALR